MDSREVAPTTDSGLRSASNAARLCNRSPAACLIWLRQAPPEVRRDIRKSGNMLLLGRTAVEWLKATSDGRRRVPRKDPRPAPPG